MGKTKYKYLEMTQSQIFDLFQIFNQIFVKYEEYSIIKTSKKKVLENAAETCNNTSECRPLWQFRAFLDYLLEDA